MRASYFITTFPGRLVASSVVVWLTAFIVTITAGGGRFLGETFTTPWFSIVWKHGQTGIWQPWPLAFITLLILVVAARWRWTSLIATAWFLLNTLLALWFIAIYDGKS